MLSEQTRYSRLANITKIINTKLELSEVLQHVISAISEEIVQCNMVGIYLPQKDGTFRGFVGKPEVMNGMTIDMDVIDPEQDLLTKEVIETRKTIYIADASKDHRMEHEKVEAFQVKSMLALPILLGQELFGLVFLFDYGTPMNLTESEIQSVEAYVNMAAVAIQNAKNLAQQENLVAEKQLLLDVTREMAMCSSIEASLGQCFFYLDKTLASKQMAVHFLNPLESNIITSTIVREGCQWTEMLAGIGMDRGYAQVIQQVAQTKNAMLLPTDGHQELLLMPLVSMGEVLGVVVVVNVAGEAYVDAQIQLAQVIVDTIAPTIANLLYMDQLEHRVRERTKELAAANEKVTSIIEGITDGFFALNKEWEFIYINRHQCLLQGNTAKDVLGKSIWEVFPEGVDTVIYQAFQRAMLERVEVQFEIALGNHWYEIVAYPYVEGICCMVKNSTEKKNYEKELTRLSNLNLIGQMAAGISHEIRNPMTTVRGFLQLLKKEDDSETHRGYFTLMIEELDRANSIITEFLSIGNTRTSDVEILNLNTIIQDMMPLIGADARNQSTFIQFEMNDIPELLLNRDEIRQLVINLYRNGLEAMQAGKVLTISTYQENENEVVLAVRDQGEGIRPEVMEKLGTPFYTTKDNGTGLGLGICYAIAARHHAKVDIRTGTGGTTFFIKFPC
ncbi:GAF domain-containing protein [Sporosarcina sp. FSL K6-1522]|uniref:GAF domain-containing protein n=1 Tax=Sporosarcina sp. FSL K6-1522 TaxID=2921554 RepID=UPI00315AFC04